MQCLPLLVLFAGLILPSIALAGQQTDINLEKALILKTDAKALEKSTDHAAAARAYEKAVSFGLSAEYGLQQAVGNYVAAQDPASGLAVMQRLAALGHASYAHFENSDFFEPLRSQPGFATTLAHMKDNAAQKKEVASQPEQILNFEDAQRFFEAFDKAATATKEKKSGIYNTHYFAKASPAMVDYVSMKINSIDAFAEHVETNRLYYEDLRQSLVELQQLAPNAVSALNRLRDIADADSLPQVHFIVGMHTSAGTASANGLLLGMDFITSDKTHTNTLPAWTAPFISTPNDSLWVILHEYVHFLQKTGQRTVLGDALVEGSADFLANLVYGRRSVPLPYTVFGDANRQQVVDRFLAEKDQTDFSNWTGNNGTKYANDWVADLGYYVGEQIARGFYQNSADKKAAISALLDLKDPAEIMCFSGFPN